MRAILRTRSTTLLLGVLFVLGSCGGASSASSVENYVREAMAGLPYQYKILPKQKANRYVVFKTINPRKKVDVNIAFGLPSKDHSCPKPPRLPAKHRKGFQPFFGAAGVPLICFASDSWRPGDRPEVGVIRSKMKMLVRTALCESVYNEHKLEAFACFD